jgi:ribosomal protein L32E
MTIKIKKKTHPKFNVPNFGIKKRKGVKERWRKQRGIDNKKRIKMAMMGAEPTIGYKNSESVRGIRANGKRLYRINNIEEMKNVLKNPDISSNLYDFIVPHSLSKRSRHEIAILANNNKFKVVNIKTEAKKIDNNNKKDIKSDSGVKI